MLYGVHWPFRFLRLMSQVVSRMMSVAGFLCCVPCCMSLSDRRYLIGAGYMSKCECECDWRQHRECEERAGVRHLHRDRARVVGHPSVRATIEKSSTSCGICAHGVACCALHTEHGAWRALMLHAAQQPCSMWHAICFMSPPRGCGASLAWPRSNPCGHGCSRRQPGNMRARTRVRAAEAGHACSLWHKADTHKNMQIQRQMGATQRRCQRNAVPLWLAQ